MIKKTEWRIRNLKNNDWHSIAKKVVANSKYKFETNIDYETDKKKLKKLPSFAYTDGDRIYVAAMYKEFDSYLVHKAFVSAAVIHEAAHIAYTNMPTELELKRWYNMHKIKVSVQDTLTISNIVEDGRIEALVSSRRTQWKHNLLCMNKIMFLKDFEEACQKEEVEKNDFVGFQNMLVTFIKLKLNVNPVTTKYISNPTLVNNLSEVMNLYYKEYITSNSRDSWEKLAIIIQKIQDLYPERRLPESTIDEMLEEGEPTKAAGSIPGGSPLGKSAASEGGEDASLDEDSEEATPEEEISEDEDGEGSAGAGATEEDKDDAKAEKNNSDNMRRSQKQSPNILEVQLAPVNGMRSVLSERQIEIAKKTAKEIVKLETKKIQKVANKKGTFKVKKYIKTAKQSPEVFQSKKTSISSELFMYLLIDQSGSMRGSKMEQAMSAAAILEETFKILKSEDFKIEIATFDYGAASPHCTHTMIKTFEDDLPLGRSYALASGTCGRGGNADAYNIDFATNRLQNIEHNKILVVLSDGSPVECTTKDVKKSVTKAQKQGIPVLPIFFGHFDSDLEAEYRDMYNTRNNRILNADNEDDLFNILGKIIMEYMDN